MCGRFNIIDDSLSQLLMDITGAADNWSIVTRYNIAPTEQVPVLRLDKDGLDKDRLDKDRLHDNWRLDPMRWWLVPYWSDGPATRYSMFNARSETLANSRAYREPFRHRRCIIPASGYYEWKRQGSAKMPYYVEPADEPGFAFAGLWDRWQGQDQVIESCTIVTAAAPDSMQSIHSRIPVHLTTDEARRWVDPSAAEAGLNQLLTPSIRISINVTPVSTHVNNARNKDPRAVEPLGEPMRIEKD